LLERFYRYERRGVTLGNGTPLPRWGRSGGFPDLVTTPTGSLSDKQHPRPG
jgi:hypothetical protein